MQYFVLSLTLNQKYLLKIKVKALKERPFGTQIFGYQVSFLIIQTATGNPVNAKQAIGV